MDQTTPDIDTSEDDDQEAEIALASELNRVIGGSPMDVAANAMTRVWAALLGQLLTADENGPAAEVTVYAAMLVNVHALVHPTPDLSVSTLAVGKNPLTPEILAAAEVLYPPLYHLMMGLRCLYAGNFVAHSWIGVMLSMLFEEGPNGENGLARAQEVLKDMHDGLPAAYAQMVALRAMDAGANTSERGSA